ncbi:hypothetical protein BDV30DRAFT_110302 [Aspergillus minisclerotigenes]|uniref:Uncharacterized protein n=1 Tax=Aspergillus minisclerotigenes TaxID=656917 RepID=A0A5N6J3F2_9EURO|nr:hypothetical protein BDV30DRAFT_110302 [Aspergillus minisclerotigenes]
MPTPQSSVKSCMVLHFILFYFLFSLFFSTSFPFLFGCISPFFHPNLIAFSLMVALYIAHTPPSIFLAGPDWAKMLIHLAPFLPEKSRPLLIVLGLMYGRRSGQTWHAPGASL